MSILLKLADFQSNIKIQCHSPKKLPRLVWREASSLHLVTLTPFCMIDGALIIAC